MRLLSRIGAGEGVGGVNMCGCVNMPSQYMLMRVGSEHTPSLCVIPPSLLNASVQIYTTITPA